MKHLANQCYDSISTTCFITSPYSQTIEAKSLLTSTFLTQNHKPIKLILYPNCIVIAEQDSSKPSDSPKTFVLNNRCSYQILRALSDKTSKYQGIVFFDNQDKQKKDIFYNNSEDVCLRWNEVLSDLLHQKGFGQNYQLLEIIGKGHSCQVYKAKKRSNGQLYAVKAYQRRGDLRSEQAFLNEIQTLRSLNHPNILKIHESFLETRFIFAVTQYCPAGTLYQQVTTKNMLTKQEQIKIIVDLTNAVEHLRTMRIVHRDIKLENIFVKKEGEERSYVLGDFGLAVQMDQGVPIFETCGTVGYTAPEVLRHTGNKPIALSHKMDTFPLGVIYHIVFLKRTVFQYTLGDMAQLAALNKKCYINWKQDFYAKLPKQQLQLLQCTLTQNPQNRFTTKQILSLPFFKKHLKHTKSLTLEDSDSKTILSTSTRPNSNHSSSFFQSSRSTHSLTNSLKNLFAPKYKRTETVKVETKDKWNIINWFKGEEKGKGKDKQKEKEKQYVTKNSLELESGFVQEKNYKERFMSEQF